MSVSLANPDRSTKKEHGPHDSPAEVHEHARSGECVLLRWNLDRFQLAYKMPATEHHVFCYLG